MFYVGIDIGGTNVKAALIDQNGKIVKKSSIPTLKTADGVLKDIIQQIKTLTQGVEYQAVGIGCAGAIDSKNGIVEYSNNLAWTNVHIVDVISKGLNKPTKVSNDANVAALGEAKFGAGKQYSDSILVTLGTGVGGGFVVDGKLFEGYKSMGTEIGHTSVVSDGELCTCGRKGCLEAYASATALIRETICAMQEDKDSAMWDYVGGDIKKVDGKTSFECAKKGDVSAKKVVDDYIRYLGEGLTNVVNLFRSPVIILGGGVCAQGEYLTKPLQEFVDKNRFGGEKSLRTIISIATLGNDAGVIGAASLVME